MSTDITISEIAVVNAMRDLHGNPSNDCVSLAVIGAALNERDLLIEQNSMLVERFAMWLCWADRATYVNNAGRFARDSENYWQNALYEGGKGKWRNLAAALLSGHGKAIEDVSKRSGAPSMPGFPKTAKEG